MQEEFGKWIFVLGVILLMAGALMWLFGDYLDWLGHLPGDIRIERKEFSIYFPVTTMIIISILLSILFTIFSRFIGK